MSLEEIAERYAATTHQDRHGDKLTIHSYIPVYSRLLRPYRQRCRLLEVGVAAGLSLQMWQEFMPSSLVCGLDCSDQWLTEDILNRFEIAIGHSNVPSAREKVARLSSEFDVIIDDGDHDPSIQIGTIHNLMPLLASGGTYVIEDVANIDSWRHEFEILGKQYNLETDIVDLRTQKGRRDDVLVVYKKKT